MSREAAEKAMIDLPAIRKMMDGVTEGPWAVHPVHARVDAFVNGVAVPVCQMLWPTDARTEEETEANARFIAASPAIVRQLLDEVERLTKENDGLNASAYLKTKAIERADILAHTLRIRIAELEAGKGEKA